jgi:MGT family glycosyltransferase
MRNTIVAICMRSSTHLQLMMPAMDRLMARGFKLHVMTHPKNRQAVESCGAEFFDLFSRYPIDAADATSIPLPTRYVSFAAAYAEDLACTVAAIDPAFIFYETSSVVAPVVGRILGLPYINLLTNHAPVSGRLAAELVKAPGLAISPQCKEAVRHLRESHGIAIENPFFFAEGLSPFLNLYSEPEEFLVAEDRAALAPIAFFGGLALDRRAQESEVVFPQDRSGLRIYVSFGTLIWRYFEKPAYAALLALSRILGDCNVDVVIGLGGHDLNSTARAELERPNVRIVSYSKQWAELQSADVFITHNGLNSTHEAIFHGVPMISYPFYADQPLLARRCQQLGLAVSLVDEPLVPIQAESVQSALARLRADSDGFRTRLEEARSWELRTISNRDAVIDRMLALAEKPQGN